MGHEARDAREAGRHAAMSVGLLWLGGSAGGMVLEGQLQDADGDMGL